jgi:hypothetical protein
MNPAPRPKSAEGMEAATNEAISPSVGIPHCRAIRETVIVVDSGQC